MTMSHSGTTGDLYKYKNKRPCNLYKKSGCNQGVNYLINQHGCPIKCFCQVAVVVEVFCSSQ